MFDLLHVVFLVALIGAAVGMFQVRRARMREVFAAVASRRDGKLGQGPWGLYPSVTLAGEGVGLHLSGVHGSRNGRATRTFVWAGCDTYPDLSLDVRRKPNRVGALERLGQQDAATGDGEFDAAFWVHSDGGDAAREFLDDELRAALLAFDPGLRVRLRVGEFRTFPEGWRTGEMKRSLEVAVRGLPPGIADVELLIDLAHTAHARLLAEAVARAA